MKKDKQILSSLIIASITLFIGCRKNISLPDADLENIFGKWNWVQSSGGFSGSTMTPATEGRTATIEFTKKGVCYITNGNDKDKMEYTLLKGNSIYSTELADLISYKDIGLFDKENAPITQSIRFGGKDTLFLNDECFDCFGHVYVREK